MLICPGYYERAGPIWLSPLSGIVAFGDEKKALLEWPPDRSNSKRFSLLSEMEREGELEVVEILPKVSTVKLFVYAGSSKSALTLTNDAGHEGADSGVRLERASLEPVLRLFSELTGRTLLRSPRLPNAILTVAVPGADRPAAASAIQKALRNEAIAAIPDGTKFTIIVPEKLAKSVKPRSVEIKPAGPLDSEVLPAGAIYFPSTDIGQVLRVYAEVSGRKFDVDRRAPGAAGQVIRLQNQTGLTRAEVLYALDTVPGFAGVEMVRVGDDRIKNAVLPDPQP